MLRVKGEMEGGRGARRGVCMRRRGNGGRGGVDGMGPGDTNGGWCVNPNTEELGWKARWGRVEGRKE